MFWILIDLIIFNLVIAVILEIYASVEADLESYYKKIELSKQVRTKYESKTMTQFRQDCQNIHKQMLRKQRQDMEVDETDSLRTDEGMSGQESSRKANSRLGDNNNRTI